MSRARTCLIRGLASVALGVVVLAARNSGTQAVIWLVAGRVCGGRRLARRCRE
jgi:hypothetical protein